MDIEACLTKLESHVRSRAYSGYSKFDALNSPFLQALFGHTALSRLLITQVVNRVPLPLRAWLGVQPSRNPKGIGNFLRGYCLQHEMGRDRRGEIVELADWLVENDSASRGQYRGPGRAWGYNFPWQSPGFFAPRFAPNCIVTVFVAEALHDAFLVTRDARYLEAARGAARFLLEALPVLEEDGVTKCIGYVTQGLRWKVVNINAVAGGFLSRLSATAGEEKYLEEATKMIRWVCGVQQADHSWNYTEPKSQSGIGPDNYHTGGILDGIGDLLRVRPDERIFKVWQYGMDYYRNRFFEEDGAPRWRPHQSFPQDVHGAAQGILSFARAADVNPDYLPQAERILNWAVTHLQGPHGGFYYQKRKRFTWKLELMRWNNSWMFWAMNEYQRALRSQLGQKKVGT